VFQELSSRRRQLFFWYKYQMVGFSLVPDSATHLYNFFHGGARMLRQRIDALLRKMHEDNQTLLKVLLAYEGVFQELCRVGYRLEQLDSPPSYLPESPEQLLRYVKEPFNRYVKRGGKWIEIGEVIRLCRDKYTSFEHIPKEVRDFRVKQPQRR